MSLDDRPCTGEDAPVPGVPDPAPPAQRPLPLAWTIGLVAALSVYLATQARAIWHEYQSLRGDIAQASRSVAIDYPNTFSTPSLAARPAAWSRVEGESLILWGGWDRKRGHTWFRLNRDDLTLTRISPPAGRDIEHAIDRPYVEVGGGRIWDRLPSQEAVAGWALEGVSCAYPLPLLRRVVVVNDRVMEHPYLVVLEPTEGAGDVCIFDAGAAGRTLSFGTSGYRLGGDVVLYDRETESLWSREAGALRAIGGAAKGTRLPLVGHPTPVAWETWRSEHPDARLLVGARAAGTTGLAAK